MRPGLGLPSRKACWENLFLRNTSELRLTETRNSWNPTLVSKVTLTCSFFKIVSEFTNQSLNPTTNLEYQRRNLWPRGEKVGEVNQEMDPLANCITYLMLRFTEYLSIFCENKFLQVLDQGISVIAWNKENATKHTLKVFPVWHCRDRSWALRGRSSFYQWSIRVKRPPWETPLSRETLPSRDLENFTSRLLCFIFDNGEPFWLGTTRTSISS